MAGSRAPSVDDSLLGDDDEDQGPPGTFRCHIYTHTHTKNKIYIDMASVGYDVCMLFFGIFNV